VSVPGIPQCLLNPPRHGLFGAKFLGAVLQLRFAPSEAGGLRPLVAFRLRLPGRGSFRRFDLAQAVPLFGDSAHFLGDPHVEGDLARHGPIVTNPGRDEVPVFVVLVAVLDQAPGRPAHPVIGDELSPIIGGLDEVLVVLRVLCC